jgi:hypothetical protein
MLPHDLAANFSHPQRATDVKDMYSALYIFLDINIKIFIHVSVIPLI